MQLFILILIFGSPRELWWELYCLVESGEVIPSYFHSKCSLKCHFIQFCHSLYDKFDLEAKFYCMHSCV